MLKKQRRLIIISLPVIAGLVLVYFLVLAPMLIPPAVEIELPELLDGEVLGINNRILLTNHVTRSEIAYVRVQNHVDEYVVFQDPYSGRFFVETAEFAHVDPEVLAQFMVNVGYLLSMFRVAARDVEDGNEIMEDMEQFGFAEDNANFTVTKLDGTWYRIIIGDRIPTEGGYYVMFEDENGLREAIYILDTMMSNTVLANRYALLTPLVTRPMGMTDIIFLDNFRFYRDNQLFLHIYNAEIPEYSDALVNRYMAYPAPYDVSDNFNALLTTLLSGLRGERVVYAFGIDYLMLGEYDEYDDIFLEVFERFGLMPPASRIMFETQDGEQYDLLFSAPNEDGNYYVFDMHFQTIVEVTPEALSVEHIHAPLTEWELRRFIDRAIFMRNINDVADIEVRSPGQHVRFELEGLNQDLIVRGGNVGEELQVIYTPYFRQWYIGTLMIELWEEEPDPRVEGSAPIAELEITMRNGRVYHFAFYFVPTNTRRSFFTLNGSGEFYVMHDRVRKLINDTDLVLAGYRPDAAALE